MISRKIVGVEVHPAADIFPLMGEEALAALADDIRSDGQRESCIIWQGKLIDGRNRWLACQHLNIEPETAEIEDDAFDVMKYVLSANLHRRQLSTTQRALVGARAREFYDRQAKERQKRKGANSVVENFPQQNGKARDAIGSAVGVSGKTIDLAAILLEHGSQELITAVETDAVAVSKAAAIAKTTPKREQLETALQKRPKAKPKTPFQQLQHWWAKTDAASRRRFIAWTEDEDQD